MKNFKPEHFKGSGQYLIFDREPENKYTDVGYLYTLLFKVGYHHGKGFIDRPEEGNIVTLTSLSDGFTTTGYFEKNGSENSKDWTYKQWNSKQDFCDHLNQLQENQELRFATKNEVISALLYENHRYSNNIPKTKYITWEIALVLEESISFLSNYLGQDNEIHIIVDVNGEVDTEKTQLLNEIAEVNRNRVKIFTKVK